MAAENFTNLPHFSETFPGQIHLPVFRDGLHPRLSTAGYLEGDQFMPIISNGYDNTYDYSNGHLIEAEHQNDYNIRDNSQLIKPWAPSRKTNSAETSRNFQSQLPDLYDSRASIVSYTSSPTLEGSDVRYLENDSVQSSWSSPPEYARTEIYPDSPHSRFRSSEEEESFCEKPYARLIFEALMQAPEHKMMLREIYEWFQKNTTKPQESGTNGWQNSIRHNLSMNKAFENDKVEVKLHHGIPKKANSIWRLTEHAMKNGVQSTTRYRKAGNSKKITMNRTPAVQRQESGAKGGRAARRTARLRRKEQNTGSSKLPSIGSAVESYQQTATEAVRNDVGVLYNAISPMSTDEERLVARINVPYHTHDATDLSTYIKSEFRDIGVDQHQMHNAFFHQSQDLNLRQDPEMAMAMTIHDSRHPEFVPSFHW